jgi:hypothetical protein
MEIEELKKFVGPLIEVPMSQRPKVFHDTVQSVLGKFVAKGWGFSPHIYPEIERVAREELETCGRMLIESYIKVMEHAVTEMPADAESKIKEELDSFLDTHALMVRSQIAHIRKGCTQDRSADPIELRLPVAKQLKAELDIHSLRIRNARMEHRNDQHSVGSAHITVHGDFQGGMQVNSPSARQEISIQSSPLDAHIDALRNLIQKAEVSALEKEETQLALDRLAELSRREKTPEIVRKLKEKLEVVKTFFEVTKLSLEVAPYIGAIAQSIGA